MRLLFAVGSGLPFCQPMVEQGKEGEAEEGGEDEGDGVGLNECCTERLPYLQTEEIDKHGDAQHGHSDDGGDGNDLLAAVGLHLFAMDALHGCVGEVGGQAFRLDRSEGLTEGAWVS